MLMILWKALRPTLLANLHIILAVVALYGFYRYEMYRAFNAGKEYILAEQKKEIERRSSNAQQADEASRACAADPACRMRDDGHRRD
jgi:hypothetical protein